MIKLYKLNKYYNHKKNNEVHVINDSSLEFSNSGLVCILGESGSGKTTLLNTIGGLDKFHSGIIQIDNEIIDKYQSKVADRIRNEKFGYIFQNYYLLHNQTVFYNIALTLSLFNMSEKEKNERIDYVLKSVGMLKYKKRLVSQLSGGQQQRVAIARALAKSPSIIIADEPTGNLDEKNTLQVMSIIKKISRNCLVLLVTHERSLADFFADRIIEIVDGRIVSDVLSKAKTNFVRKDDNNIYLGDFHNQSSVVKNVETVLYSENANEDIPKIKINVVFYNNSLYLNAQSDLKIEYIFNKEDRNIYDGSKPTLDIQEMEDINYDLPKLMPVKSAHLDIMEMFKMARTNLTTMPKRKIFMYLCFVAVAILFVLLLTNAFTTLNINENELLFADKDTLYVDVSATTFVSTITTKCETARALEDMKKENIDFDIYPIFKYTLRFNYEGIEQMKKVNFAINNYTMISVDKLNNDDLLCGRMPIEKYEIVIDEWLLDDMFSKILLTNSNAHSNDYFLDKILEMTMVDYPLKIVGVARTSSKTIYISEPDLFSMTSSLYSSRAITLSRFQELYPSELSGIVLEDNEYIDISQKDYMVIPNYFDTNNRTLSYVYASGEVTDNHGYDYIFNDNGYFRYKMSVALYTSVFNIYTKDKYAVEEYIDHYDFKYTKMELTDYSEKIQEERLNAIQNFLALLVVFVIVVIVSLLVLYFTMRTNAISNIYDIGVYRCIGIPKKSIIGIFSFEIILATTIATGTSVVACALLIWIINASNLLEKSLICPWYAFLGVIGINYLLNLFIGLIPIFGLLKLPPAELSTKYDI